MAKNWCKIIELDTHDVLVQKHFENNSQSIIISFKDDEEGLILKATIGVKEESEVNQIFENFSEKDAQNIIKLLLP